jgi:uridine kinase
VPSACDVDEIVAMTLRRAATCGRTRIVSVDGPAGSGKTTLARALAAAFAASGDDVTTVETLHMDDLYEGWEGLRPELEPRLVRQVLKPLSAECSARWQRYDWRAARFDGWVDLPVCDVLVIEGCGSGARAYDPYRTTLVWVEAGRDTRLARGIDRDGEQARPHWLAWMELEQSHFLINATRERADVAIRTD